MNQAVEEKEDIYYVRCLTQRTTAVGSTMFMPNVGPMPINESFYEANRAALEHYVDHGTIAIDKPGDRSFKASVTLANVYAKKADEEELQSRYIPPKGMAIHLGGPRAVPRTLAEQVGAQSVASMPPSTDLCIAMTRSGSQCRSKPTEDSPVCPVHLRLVQTGKKVMGIDGNELTRDDVEAVI